MSGSPLQAGARLGRYQVLEPLGAGAMGQVYLARDVSLGRQVAIKALAEAHLGRTDLRIRFAREARAVAAISHPNVVQIFDISEEDGRPYFVMEYLQGTDANALLVRRGQLTISEAVAIGLSSALGLSEAAAAGVVHRDVKPANLFLTDRGTVKVTDFGLAKSAALDANLTGDGITLGTPDYMPPEQGQGLPVDSRADIYALGATLFHLLTGRAPFRGRDERLGYAEVVVRHIRRPVPRLEDELPGIDSQLADLVFCMLAKNPAGRPSYAQVIATLREVAVRLNAALPGSSALPAAPSASGSAGDAPRLVETGESPTVDEHPQARLLAAGRPSRPAALHARLGLPGWAVAMTVASMTVLLGALAVYLYVSNLPPLPGPPSAPEPPTKPDRGRRWWRRLKLPPGNILLFVPGRGPLAVAEQPVTLGEVRLHAPRLTSRVKVLDGVAASGLSLTAARELARKLGGRLPSSLEWLHIEASGKVRLWPSACEWVDDGPARPARCYKGTRPVKRSPRAYYRDSLFRVVRPIERPNHKRWGRPRQGPNAPDAADSGAGPTP